jgi:lipoprotein-anchoring transpeptidase ErfK/SrfK
MVQTSPHATVFSLALLIAGTTLAAQQGTPAAQPRSPRAEAPGVVDELVALQVALDRARFSPGEIDGKLGDNTKRALAAFRQARGLAAPPPTTGNAGNAGAVGTAGRKGNAKADAAPPPAVLDADTRAALQPWIDEPLTDYVIGEPDVAGPFAPVPPDLMEQSRLPALGYASAVELLAERFHLSPALLGTLNPGARFAAGETLRVPNVEPMRLPTTQGPLPGKDDAASPVVVEVTEADRLLRVRRGQELLLVAPVTVGSEHDPLPVGDWVVTDVFLNPIFNYNPDLFWDADETHAKARIAAGPNNPVGPVWVGIDKEHFGLHGAPSPNTVGHTQSHGCIRLTNWDALTLAGLARKGAKVVLR